VKAARVVALVACLVGCGYRYAPVLLTGTPEDIRAAATKASKADIAAGHPRIALAGTEDGAQPLGVPDEALPLVAKLPQIVLPSGCTHPLAGEAMIYAEAYNAVLVAYLRASGVLQARVPRPPEATTTARGPSCPALVPSRPKRCIADPDIAVQVNACNAVKAEVALLAANKVYQAGLCTSLPGFTAFPGVPCTVATRNCADGVLGFVVQTITPNRNSPFRRCVFDACSTAANQLSCSGR